MLEKKHLVFLAGATAPFAPPAMYGPDVVYARLEGEVNSGGIYRDVKYQVILRVILSSAAHRSV